MALTNRLYESARKTTLTTAALALTGLASLVTPSYSADQPNQAQQTQTQVREERNYTFKSFQKLYGEKTWSELDNSRKKAITEKWSELDKDYKKALIEIYTNPEDFYKNHLTKEQRKEYEEFSKTELSTDPKKTNSFLSSALLSMLRGVGEAVLEEHYPWITNASNLSQKEKLSIYMDFRLQESFRSQEETKMPKWYSEMTPQEIKESEKYWKSLKTAEKKRMTQVFQDPKEYIKKYFDRKEQKDFQEYFFSPDATNISEEEATKLDQYESIFPWKKDIKRLCNPKITDDYTNTKRLMEYLKSKDFEKDGDFIQNNTKK
jgi:hypothetical protein